MDLGYRDRGLEFHSLTVVCRCISYSWHPERAWNARLDYRTGGALVARAWSLAMTLDELRLLTSAMSNNASFGAMTIDALLVARVFKLDSRLAA